MSIGIRLHDVAGAGLGDRAQSAAAQGFGCVHLALSKVLSPAYMEPAAATPGLARDIMKTLGPLDVAVLGCYLNLAHPDETAYAQTVQKYVAQLKLCRWMGAGVVGTETGNPNAEYRYDPRASHTDKSLELFIRRLAPVVAAAERIGAAIAIEPVYTHIVSDGRSARRVLDAIASPALQIILDPVNLLHADTLARRDEVIAEAIELLGAATSVLHMKDYRVEQGAVVSVPVGMGEMDYTAVMDFVAREKPHMHITLEDTAPDNAQTARLHAQRLLDEAWRRANAKR